jgi:hypothetical protein
MLPIMMDQILSISLAPCKSQLLGLRSKFKKSVFEGESNLISIKETVESLNEEKNEKLDSISSLERKIKTLSEQYEFDKQVL